MGESEYREILEQAANAIRQAQAAIKQKQESDNAEKQATDARARLARATAETLEQYPALTLTVKEVSKLGGWSDRTTVRLIECGKLKAVRVQGMWRINKMAFFDFVDGRE